MGTISEINTLLLYVSREKDRTLGYFDDWRNAFLEEKRFNTTDINLVEEGAFNAIKDHVKKVDLIVLLHSTNGDTLEYLAPLVDLLNTRRGKLVSFVGNEVNLPGCLLSDKIDLIKKMDADFIATQLPLSAGEYLYGELRSKVIAVPHALNCRRFKPVKDIADRGIDIGVRAHKYKGILGDDERNRITDLFRRNDFCPPLTVDIETDMFKRFFPDEWMSFLNNCKGTVSTEAGSYYLERDDATVKKYLKWIVGRQTIQQKSFDAGRNWYKKILPGKIRNLISKKVISMKHGIIQRKITDLRKEDCSFDEIFETFFKNKTNPVSGKCISSRHFEAIGTKTIQIMFPGNFNGILIENKHYLALNKNFSNIEEVLLKFRDVSFVRKMADETYAYIMDKHLFKHRTEFIYRTISG